VHAWNEEVVAQVIGGQCAIHYVEEHSRRCDRTRTYDLWAWCLDPTKVPKGVFLTITDPDREGAISSSMSTTHPLTTRARSTLRLQAQDPLGHR
jgi:hypothetical protein